MLITTVSAPVQPGQAKGADDKSCPEEPSHSAAPLDTVRPDHAYHDGTCCKEFTIEQKVEKIPEKLLARPPDNETWRRYLVRAHQLEPLLPFFENILSVHIVGKTSNDKHYDVVVCDSYVLLLQHVGCTFKFRSEDGSVDVAPTESTAPDEFVHVNSANCNDSSGTVHVGPTESDELNRLEFTESHKPHECVCVGPTESEESEQFVLVENPDTSLSTAGANEPTDPSTKPTKYKNIVSVTGNVVFVDFKGLEFDHGLRSGKPSDKVEESLKNLHRDSDVSQPRQREIDVYGCCKAKELAQNRFVMNAVRAVSSGKHGQGLDRFYLSSLNYHNAHNLSLAIEWAILTREIKSSTQDVIMQFFQHCLFITSHALHDPELACNSWSANWNDVKWLSFFEEVSSTRWQSRSTDAVMQALSFLQAIFASARDGAGPRSDAFKRKYLNRENVENLSTLFFDDTELEIVPIGGLEPAILEQRLRQFKIFEDCDELDVAQLTEKTNSL